MASIERAIDVNVPVTVAYNQWTQFADYPRFMEGVERVEVLDGDHLRWTASIAGRRERWDAEVLELIPDLLISWSSTTGAKNAGTVTFHSLDGDHTRISFLVEYDPEGMDEDIGDKLDFVSRRIEGDLQRFKAFIEARSEHASAWGSDAGEGQPFHP